MCSMRVNHGSMRSFLYKKLANRKTTGTFRLSLFREESGRGEKDTRGISLILMGDLSRTTGITSACVQIISFVGDSERHSLHVVACVPDYRMKFSVKCKNETSRPQNVSGATLQ